MPQLLTTPLSLARPSEARQTDAELAQNRCKQLQLTTSCLLAPPLACQGPTPRIDRAVSVIAHQVRSCWLLFFLHSSSSLLASQNSVQLHCTLHQSPALSAPLSALFSNALLGLSRSHCGSSPRHRPRRHASASSSSERSFGITSTGPGCSRHYPHPSSCTTRETQEQGLLPPRGRPNEGQVRRSFTFKRAQREAC